jgi:NADPH:quinone reductase-like Zn-dependent oxidoreductase
MKAVVMREYGGPDFLKYEDLPDPAVSCTEEPVKTQSR